MVMVIITFDWLGTWYASKSSLRFKFTIWSCFFFVEFTFSSIFFWKYDMNMTLSKYFIMSAVWRDRKLSLSYSIERATGYFKGKICILYIKYHILIPHTAYHVSLLHNIHIEQKTGRTHTHIVLHYSKTQTRDRGLQPDTILPPPCIRNWDTARTKRKNYWTWKASLHSLKTGK